MKQKLDFVKHTLEELKKEDLYRQLRYGRIDGPHITIGTQRLLNFCSNDYLGLKPSKLTLKQLQSSSRLVSGNDVSFFNLEKKLAKHKSQESSLVFPTGYMANLGVIPALIRKQDVIFSDELNHASIIEACKLSGAKVTVYKHNDMDDLTKKIHSYKTLRKFVITEGIFSMDGDLARLKEISEITEKNDAVLILDDAHGDFTIGADGRGTAKHFGVEKKVDAYISSLSKGLGSFGGYVASSESVIELCINKARSFIYTSALPGFLAELSMQRFTMNREKQRKKLEKNRHFLSSRLKEIGYNIQSPSHIIPIIIGKEKDALQFGRHLYENGIFAQPIRYPTVPKNSARLRISVTAWLEKTHLENALDVFEKAAKKFNL